jgi:hypothetical protein
MKEHITRRELLERVGKVTVVAGVSTIAKDGSGVAKENRLLQPEAKAGLPREDPASEEAGQSNPTLDVRKLNGSGIRARSWEPGVKVIPGHESQRAIDNIPHTYWAVSAHDLPADLGVEWEAPRKVASVVVRYFDGKMVRGPAMARTQQWARLQYWASGNWKDLSAEIIGQETSSVRYTFPPVDTTRVRLLFTEPPDPESRRTPEPLGIYVSEFEVYSDVPFQAVDSPEHILIRSPRTKDYYNEWGSDNPYDVAGPLVIEPKRTRVFSDVLAPTLIVAESRWAQIPCSVDRSRKGRIAIKNGFLAWTFRPTVN